MPQSESRSREPSGTGPRRGPPEQRRHAALLGNHRRGPLRAEIAVRNEQGVDPLLLKMPHHRRHVLLIADHPVGQHAFQVRRSELPPIEPLADLPLKRTASSWEKTNLPIGQYPSTGCFSMIGDLTVNRSEHSGAANGPQPIGKCNRGRHAVYCNRSLAIAPHKYPQFFCKIHQPSGHAPAAGLFGITPDAKGISFTDRSGPCAR